MQSILGDLEFDDREGEIFLNQSRFMLIRPETLAALAQGAGEGAAGIFFRAGQAGGRIAAENIWEARGRDPEAAIKALLEMGGAIGWARMALESYDGEARSFLVEARSLTLNWPGGAGWEMLGGILSALGETIFRGPVSVERSGVLGGPQDRARVRYTVLAA